MSASYPMVVAELRRFVSPGALIQPTATLGQLGLDSLDALELAIDLEDSFGINLGELGWLGFSVSQSVLDVCAKVDGELGGRSA
jgi:acyl carrier protein